LHAAFHNRLALYPSAKKSAREKIAMPEKITLAELQHELQEYVLNQHKDVRTLTLETPNFSAQERLGIYLDAYRLRLIEALTNDFAALRSLIGDELFTPLMKEYIQLHPSHHPSIRWIGEKLPTFLRSHIEWQKHVNVCELAEFEWAQTMAFDAEDAMTASLDDLRKLEPTQWFNLQLIFQPALQLFKGFSNVPDLWHELINNEKACDLKLNAEIQYWIIWRTNLQVMYRAISAAEALSLTAFMQNKTFTNICNGLSEWFPEDQVPLKAAQFLQSWIQNGMVKEIIAGDLGVKNSV
jgi:hypothetical protein